MSAKREINKELDRFSFREDSTTQCGIKCFRPYWIQRFATKTWFLVIFSILGVIQGMTWSYFSATISTLEKRLKISSQTAGIVMTGNEISQTLFSIILAYYGGNGHRPRWISAGVALSAISCILLASPHFFYGPGDEVLSLTEEFYYSFHSFGRGYLNPLNDTGSENISIVGAIHQQSQTSQKHNFSKKLQMCELESDWSEKNLDCGAGEKSMLPLVLIFLSQFVSGIGNVLFMTLSGPYIDDNMKQVQMPKMMGIVMSLRLVGPLLGYAFASVCLNCFISPTLTPLINNDDPRWMGAWWSGWVFFGIMMGITSFFIALFPRELPRKNRSSENTLEMSETKPSSGGNNNMNKENVEVNANFDDSKPTISDLVKGIKMLTMNKVNMYNNLAAVFYLFGVMGFATYLNKYIENVFKVNRSIAAGIPAVATIGFQAIGLISSGFLISKYQPSARKLAGLNVISGLSFIVVLVAFTQFTCHQGTIHFGSQNVLDKSWNLTETCNVDCNCKAGQMLPVCFKDENKIYYSACHAGCSLIDNTTISNCSCLPSLNHTVEMGTCSDDCLSQFMIFLGVSAFVRVVESFGRIGNMLISYRCVHPKHKALALGIGVFLATLFGMLPSPILFGAIIDSVCLVWGTKCGAKGNCLMYDGEKLAYVFNLTAAGFIMLGVMFDCLVCYHVKDLDLYNETNNDHKINDENSPTEKSK